MQTTITGQVVTGQQMFINAAGTFRKQVLIVQVVNGNYTSFFPVEFVNGDIDTLLPQVQLNGTYSFTCYVQGSNQQMTDKNGQPTAYLSLKVTSVTQPGQQQAPAQNNFQNNPAPANNFQAQAQPVNNNGGFVGGAPANNNFAQPANNNFNQPAQPAQTNAFAQPNNVAPNQGNNFAGQPIPNGFTNPQDNTGAAPNFSQAPANNGGGTFSQF